MSTTPFFKTDCPSCGAPVQAYSATAVTLVCSYCNSMLVRHDGSIADTGRDSALLEDFSPLQIGTTGRFLLRGFSIIGRLQAYYDGGVWNEWYVLFDDGHDGWLSEAGDLYVMTMSDRLLQPMPNFHDIRAGFSTLNHNGKQFMASDVREISLSQTAVQGELPFRIQGKTVSRTADWRCENLFLTLDYAEAEPQAFVGRMVKLDDLHLTNTRSDDQIRESAGRLKGLRQTEGCPNCGGSVHWVSGLAEHIVCPSCASELQADKDKIRLIEANHMRQAQGKLFMLPVGSQGRLKNRDYYVMGAVRYSETGAQETFDKMFGMANHALVAESWWAEYLLYHPQHGFGWLVQTAEGKWSVSETLNEWPRLNQYNQPQGCEKLYDYGGRVEVAAGAFYWQVRQGDLNYYTDYRQGSGKLSAALSKNELAWSKNTPIRYSEIAQAFGLTQSRAPQYTANMRSDGVSNSLRLLMMGILLMINAPAWLMMGSEQIFNESMIPTIFGIAFIWFLGRSDDD
ncbi:DUF4178 domain-containing protein [Neisseria iguanae]|uniref:DUF4178 domain-containing protein n=1 Tax=Neisseria iguanae TaxID=90242 RepID=A0A2P7TZJ4_9NEIS|nr:DUF4178 domain-containing protein [Neisseria iguanae]PSJ80127.1 DUF4178 domain-containing protein [Neisseria iguanae]